MHPVSQAIVALSLSCWLARDAGAGQIAGPNQLSFSGAVGVTTVVAGSYDAAVDGALDTPGSGGTGNGVSLQAYPLTVTYNFDKAYDIQSLFLLGEFGSNHIGAIKFFDVMFYSGLDGTGVQVGSAYSGAQTLPTTLQPFDLSNGGYIGVRSFSLTPHTDVHDSGHPAAVAGRVEWSEIQFGGDPSRWTDLGHGLAGSNGVPVLTGVGSLIAGEPMSLVLTNALENTAYLLVVGLSTSNTPFKGGVLVPSPDLVLVFPPVFPGSFTIGTNWPTGVPPANTLVFQYWIDDPSGPQGFAASNGLSGTTP